MTGEAFVSPYTVTVDTGGGTGTIRLDAIDNDSIIDEAGNPLGGSGFGNGDFSSGDVYSNVPNAPATSALVLILLALTILVMSTTRAANRRR